MTLTDPATFVVLGLHAVAYEEACQEPKIDEREALQEVARDCELAELRLLMENR